MSHPTSGTPTKRTRSTRIVSLSWNCWRRLGSKVCTRTKRSVTHVNLMLVVLSIGPILMPKFAICCCFLQGNCGFGGAWSFVVAFKAYGTRKRWFRNSAEIDLVMMKRGKRAISGANPFIYFDGPTMQSYQVPPRQIETVFCRRRPMPLECRDARYIYNPELSSVPISSFEVRASGQGKMSGRGVYTKELIPPHTYIAPEQAIHAIRFYPYTYKLIVDLEDESPIEYLFKKLDIPWKGRAARQVKCLEYYVHAYGFTSRKHVSLSTYSTSP